MGNRELTAYREANVQGASPVEVVIMLYDVLVRDLKKVIGAIRASDIQERVDQSNHAFQVLQELECLLDMERGGTTARDLSRFYSHVRAKLMEVQFKLDSAILQRQIEMVLDLRQGWVEAMGVPEAGPMTGVPAAAEIGAYLEAGAMEEARYCGWSA
jgi:flagellar protein FliS